MRKPAIRLLLLFLILGVVGFLIYRSSAHLPLSNFSWSQLFTAIREARPAGLVLSVVVIFGAYAVRAARWQVFQKNLGPSSFWNIYKLTLAGFSAIVLLSRAGEPVRPLLLARKEKLPVADMFGIFVLERIFDFASMAVITAVGLLLFQAHGQMQSSTGTLQTAMKTAGTLLSVSVLGAIAFLLYLRLHGAAFLEKRFQDRLGEKGWRAATARAALGLARGVQAIRSWGQLLLAVTYSALHWGLVLLTYLWITNSFDRTLGTLSLDQAMLVMASTLVGSVVQLPVMGGGSQAGTIVAYAAIFGVEKEPAAVAAAMVLWLITFAGCSLAGVPILIREGWSLGKLREMTKHENEVIDAAVAGEPDQETLPGESSE